MSLFYESNSWTLSTGLNLSSGRKTTAAILDFDLPKFMVMNLSALYKLNEITSFKISGQNLTNSRHIVAARPAGYRTFSPRMLVLGIQLSL
jgi:outer membrane receptor protein involved in Fe transport